MSIEVIKEGNVLRVVDSSEPILDGAHLRLFTEDEIQQAAARIAWQRISGESQEDLIHQAQTKSYQEWMADSSWDDAILREDSSSWLPLKDFQP
jgi:hypothetical protein